MPLFEVDATRPLLVQGAGGTAGGEPGVHTSAHRVVESHIDGLLGEQVFPVAQGSGPDEPHLLALDASGLPVVVELVGDLDKSTLTRALDHAGAAGRLTRGELASRYNGGPHNFAHDVADFYDSVPITQSSSPKAGGGARLIIICQNAPQEILNAVDFLRQPTMPVEVLKMDVVKSDDGRRFLDVSPLVIHLPPGLPSPRQEDRGSITRGSAPDHVTAEPVASKPMFTSRGGADPDSFAAGVKVGYALTGKLPVVAHQPGAGGQAEANSAPGSRQRASGARTSVGGSGQSGFPASGPAPIGYPAPGPTSAPAPSSEQSFAQRGPQTQAAADAPPSPSGAHGRNPAKGLRRSLAGGGADASAGQQGVPAPPAAASAPLPPPVPAQGQTPASAASSRPASDGGRALPQSRAARRAMAEQANAGQVHSAQANAAQAPAGQAAGSPRDGSAGDPHNQWAVPPQLSTERPGPAPVSAPVQQPAPPPVPVEAPVPMQGDPSVPSSDTVPRVQQQAPARRRSRSDRFAAPPFEAPMTGAQVSPSQQPPVPHADAPTLVGGSFTAHEPVPPPPGGTSGGNLPPSTLPNSAPGGPTAATSGTDPSAGDLWQPPAEYPGAPQSALIDSAPGASAFQDGHPSGAFGSVESAPFQPPVIDSRSAPGGEAPADSMFGQQAEPGFPQGMEYGQDGSYGQAAQGGFAPAEAEFGQDPAGLAGDESGFGQHQPGFAGDRTGFVPGQAAYAGGEGAFGQNPGGYAEAGFGQGPSGYAPTEVGYGQDPTGYAAPEAGYGQDQSGYAAPGVDYGQDQSGYAVSEPGYGHDQSGYDGADQWQDPAYAWSGGQDYDAPFPGRAPEAQIPPMPQDESIRANTPGLFDEEDDPDLEALARSFGAPTRIVWSRPRRSQHYEAVLYPNGVIELADGGQYRHPDTAATAASGSYTADGWSVWRIGEQGPSLTEAFQQRFV